MLDHEFRHVDVFSRQALLGNGLVVVLDAEGLSTATMQAITQEVRQFETSFLACVDVAGRTARLRIFTEDEELDFAGHPVLGSAAVLHSLLPAGTPDASWDLDVAGRRIDVRTHAAQEWVEAFMNQGPVELGAVVGGDRADTYAAAFGLSSDLLHPSLPMQVVSTGLPYLILPVTREGLERAAITHPDLESLLVRDGAKFAYVLDPERPEGRTWDNAGRVEDIATGSAAGPAVGYLLHHGIRAAGEPVIVQQGRFTGRPSSIEVRQTGVDADLWVGGPVAPVSSGRFHAHPPEA